MMYNALYSDDEIDKMRKELAKVLKPTSFNKNDLKALEKSVSQKELAQVKKAGIEAMKEVYRRGRLTNF